MAAERFIDESIKTSSPCISAITEIELLCWKTASPQDVEVLRAFIDEALVIELEREIKLMTAEIRKNNKIKLPDAIIAATAIVYRLELITHNTADFKNIQGLQLIDPNEMSEP